MILQKSFIYVDLVFKKNVLLLSMLEKDVPFNTFVKQFFFYLTDPKLEIIVYERYHVNVFISVNLFVLTIRFKECNNFCV